MRKHFTVVALVAMLVMALTPLTVGAQEEASPPEALQCDPTVVETSDILYFPETCHQVKGDFKFNWESFGVDLGHEGVSRDEAMILTGLPLTGNFDFEGLHIQIFERAILEYHPENVGTEFVILRRHLGKMLYEARKSQWAPDVTGDVAPINDPDCQYFPETKHNMCGGLLAFWNNNGGLMAFGYPLMEATFETMPDGSQVWVQYTERQRLEWHDNNPDPWKVLLGRLGAEFLDAHKTNGGGNPPPADCSTQTVSFEPTEGKIWDLDVTGRVAIANVWSNWPDTKLVGEKQAPLKDVHVRIKGGGSATLYSSLNCESIALEEMQKDSRPDTTVQELQNLGVLEVVGNNPPPSGGGNTSCEMTDNLGPWSEPTAQHIEVGGSNYFQYDLYVPGIQSVSFLLEPRDHPFFYTGNGSAWQIIGCNTSDQNAIFSWMVADATRYAQDRQGDGHSGLVVDFRNNQFRVVANVANLSQQQIDDLLSKQHAQMSELERSHPLP
jgi:hypothetical protein